MIKFKINDKEVEARAGWTVLETALQHGIYIPTLCHHESVEPTGACRLCVVELKDGDWSKVVVSCMYPVQEGLSVYTDTPRVQTVRRWILKMLLAECPASVEIKKLAEELGVTKTRFKAHDPEQDCMLCGLCVRVCKEVVGISAISTVGRGVHKTIGAPYMAPSATCVACGSCVTVCPTGAMSRRFDQVRGVPKVQISSPGK